MSGSDEWDVFVAEKFVGPYTDQADDFVIWLRLKGFSYMDFHPNKWDWLFKDWAKSRRRGKHRSILDRRRRKQFGPGKYHAATSAGVFLNKNFVKGWRGINPAQP